MVLILSIYIYLKRLDLTFLEKKHPIKANLLRFEVFLGERLFWKYAANL